MRGADLKGGASGPLAIVWTRPRCELSWRLAHRCVSRLRGAVPQNRDVTVPYVPHNKRPRVQAALSRHFLAAVKFFCANLYYITFLRFSQEKAKNSLPLPCFFVF